MLLRRSVLLNRFAIARLITALIAATFTCSAAHATEVALTGDAHVSMTRSTTNFGTLANLYVGNGNTALLQFDLSTLPAGLTASQISHATLTVFVNRVNTGGTVSLSPVTSAWSESAVTYATIPAIGASVNGFTAATAGQYVTLDVTSLVQGWVTAPATNFGLALTSTVANVLLDSKENDETGHAATLDITVTSMGATGAQGIQGAQGPAGVPGTPGVPGIPGVAGPAGAIGPAGPAGAPGTLSTVTNWSPTVVYAVGQVVYCASCSSTSNGSSYIALAGNFNVVPGSDPTVWQLIAQAGAPGIPGTVGATGATGPAGATGATGPAGPIGPAGATGTLSVTNWSSTVIYAVGQVVYCASCSSTSNGSSYVALAENFNVVPGSDPGVWQLVAQAGAQGALGMTGPQGPIGPAGATGGTGATGSAGPVGPAGQVGATGSLGTVTNWSSTANYQAGQVVFCAACSSNGSSYAALATNTDIDPPTNSAVWQPIAQAGATGAQGPIGPAGTVTSVTVGTVTNSGSTGTVSIGGTAAVPTINVNFPAGSGSGVSSVAPGTITTGGTTGSVTVSNATTTPTINVAFPLVSIYGDGSDGTTGGVCAITSATNWATTDPGKAIQCTNFSVSSGVTLTVPSGTVIRATGTVAISGTITVLQSTMPAYQASVADSNGDAGIALPAFTLRQLVKPGPGGGGPGGAIPYGTFSPAGAGFGGGSLVILSEGATTISGLIMANGGGPGSDSYGDSLGGGAGGIIVLASKASINNMGTLSAIGGQGNAAGTFSSGGVLYAPGGGGGGGVVHLLSPNNTAGTVNVGGGNVGSGTTGSYTGGNGGGASGGNGGIGTQYDENNGNVTVTATPGSAGLKILTTVTDPATLFVP
jgi:Collagen triple helix repeat (20 copies)